MLDDVLAFWEQDPIQLLEPPEIGTAWIEPSLRYVPNHMSQILYPTVLDESQERVTMAIELQKLSGWCGARSESDWNTKVGRVVRN